MGCRLSWNSWKIRTRRSSTTLLRRRETAVILIGRIKKRKSKSPNCNLNWATRTSNSQKQYLWASQHRIRWLPKSMLCNKPTANLQKRFKSFWRRFPLSMRKTKKFINHWSKRTSWWSKKKTSWFNFTRGSLILKESYRSFWRREKRNSSKKGITRKGSNLSKPNFSTLKRRPWRHKSKSLNNSKPNNQSQGHWKSNSNT